MQLLQSTCGKTTKEKYTECRREDGEQGDPLMPALFALGQHNALEAVRRELKDDEELFAFLDDVYVLCTPERARDVFDVIKRCLQQEAGIDVNLGKCRCWNRSRAVPPRMQDRGPDVWVGGHDT